MKPTQQNSKALTNIKMAWLVAAISCSLFAYGQGNSIWEGFDAYKNGEYRKAIEYFSNYLKSDPKSVDALYYRAKSYNYLEDYVSALVDLGNAIKYHSRKAVTPKDELYAARGNIYADIEQDDEALTDFTSAIKINPKNTDVLFDRANLYYHLKDYTASDADWNQVLKMEKENVHAQIGLSRNMTARGEVDDAIRLLDKLEKMDPNNPYVYKYRSRAYAQKGNYRKAIDDLIDWGYYDEVDGYMAQILSEYAAFELTYALAKVSELVVKEEEEKISWLFLRSSLYEDYEMYREAIEDYNSAEEFFESPNLNFLVSRSKCYLEMGAYDKAIEDANRGLALRDYAYLYLIRAEAKRLKGEYKPAIIDYSKSIELDPMSSFAYHKRGWTKVFDKDFEGALKDYTTSIELNNKSAYYFFLRADLYRTELNQPELAKKDYETVLLFDTVVARHSNCRQYALLHLGRVDEAIAHQQAILDQYPSSGNYYDAACLYSYMNRLTEAIAYLRTALETGDRSFVHMEHDIYLANVRETKEYKKLIEEWKAKSVELSSGDSNTDIYSEPEPAQEYVVKSKELRSGIYEMPCSVNDLPLNFIFDTGASVITLSSVEAAFMLKNNYLSEYDFRDRRNYLTASGDIMEGTKVVLRKIKVGDLELHNIEATVVHKQNAPLLFGQSAMGKFVKITIDNKNNEITFVK